MKKTWKTFISVTLVALCVLGLTAARMAAGSVQSAQSDTGTYSWSGELVAVDESAKTATLKSMVVGNALEEAGRFKTGDRIVLSWSGFDKYANAINHVVRHEATAKFDERFAFPAEFVSFDGNQRYLTFKSKIPAESVSKLQALKPGQWVTATTPHGKASETQPIVAIRQYNEPTTTS